MDVGCANGNDSEHSRHRIALRQQKGHEEREDKDEEMRQKKRKKYGVIEDGCIQNVQKIYHIFSVLISKLIFW